MTVDLNIVIAIIPLMLGALGMGYKLHRDSIKDLIDQHKANNERLETAILSTNNRFESAMSDFRLSTEKMWQAINANRVSITKLEGVKDDILEIKQMLKERQ